MKKLLVILVLLLTLTLVGCDDFNQGEELMPVDNMDACYENDSEWIMASDIICFIGEIDVQYSYLEYIKALEKEGTK